MFKTDLDAIEEFASPADQKSPVLADSNVGTGCSHFSSKEPTIFLLFEICQPAIETEIIAIS